MKIFDGFLVPELIRLRISVLKRGGSITVRSRKTYMVYIRDTFIRAIFIKIDTRNTITIITKDIRDTVTIVTDDTEDTTSLVSYEFPLSI